MAIVNKIRELRKRRNMTLQHVADAIGSTTTTIRNLEIGATELVHPLLPPLADALGVTVAALIFDDPRTESHAATGPAATPPGISESAASWTPPPDHPMARMTMAPMESLFEARDASLDRVGILPGDILVADISAAAVADVATGDIVIAQVYGPSLTEAVTVIRQYVAPDLLICNSRSVDRPPVDMSRADAAIKAIVRKRWGALPGSPRSGRNGA